MLSGLEVIRIKYSWSPIEYSQEVTYWVKALTTTWEVVHMQRQHSMQSGNNTWIVMCWNIGVISYSLRGLVHRGQGTTIYSIPICPPASICLMSDQLTIWPVNRWIWSDIVWCPTVILCICRRFRNIKQFVCLYVSEPIAQSSQTVMPCLLAFDCMQQVCMPLQTDQTQVRIISSWSH